MSSALHCTRDRRTERSAEQKESEFYEFYANIPHI